MAKETFSSLIDLFKTSSPVTVTTLVCDVCGNKLSVFRKKKPCAECKRQFCSQCLQRSRDRSFRCKNCHVLTMRPPLRSALLDLRVKDLQHYLNQHNVSTRGCLEKEDLVNVLLRYASTPGYSPPGNSGNAAPGISRQPPPGNSRNAPPDAVRNPPTSNPVSPSGPSSTTPFTSSSSSVHHSTREETTRQGDSDSSSDTSFEMVQRPNSNDNITFIHTSSSSTSVSGMSVQGNTSPSAPSEFSPTASSPTRSTAIETVTTSDPPSSVHSYVEGVASALGTMSVSSQLDTERTVVSEASADYDVPQTVLQETFEVTPEPVASQPNSSNSSPSFIRGTMASITSEADFEAFSVKQLKDILVRHRVNYHGCCEKAELVERAKRLYRDYCASRAELEKLDLDALCKICMDAPVECVMLECGHMATCTDCGRQLNECPICRQFVVRIVRTFKA